MVTQKKTYQHSAIRVCIDATEEYGIKGSLHSPYVKEGIVFQDINTFLGALDQICEDRGFPEEMFRHRSFGVTKKKKEHRQRAMEPTRNIEEIEKEMGQIATIRLYITSRKYASLQGHFVLLGNGTIQKFSSELQLLQLLKENVLQQEEQRRRLII